MWRRILAGEPPDQVSSAWPAFGARVVIDGRVLREVAFVAESAHAGDRVMIHLNGITDAHRTDIRPAVLDEVPGSAVRVIDYLLPDDMIASYRFVSLPPAELPDDVGATREGWLRVHGSGRPDPRNPRRLPNPLGLWSSVLIMPGAVEHSAWDQTAPSVRQVDELLLPLDGEFAGRVATVLTTTPDARATTSRSLVLFDGDNWERVGIRDALGRAAAVTTPSTVVLVPSGTLDERSAVLPHPERAAKLFETVIAALRTHARFAHDPGILDPVRTIVAGQSYGGLAAAALVSLRPDLVTTGIVQSGSFHFRALEEPRPPAQKTGDLVERVRERAGTGALDGSRLVIQSGTQESGMTAIAEHFARAARQAGGAITCRVYSGGHDYAWWRTGLFDALDELHESGHPESTT